MTITEQEYCTVVNGCKMHANIQETKITELIKQVKTFNDLSNNLDHELRKSQQKVATLTSDMLKQNLVLEDSQRQLTQTRKHIDFLKNKIKTISKK